MAVKDFHQEVKDFLDEQGVDYKENVRIGGKMGVGLDGQGVENVKFGSEMGFDLGANELRKLICDALLRSLPQLKQLVRSYSSQSIVTGPDFKVAIGIWKSLNSIEDATEKLSQSEF